MKNALRLAAFACVCTASTLNAQPAPPLPLPELPSISKERDAISSDPTALSSKPPAASSVALTEPELPQMVDLPGGAKEPDVAPPTPDVDVKATDSKPMDELALPTLPGMIPKDETFPVKPKAEEPTIKLTDQVLGNVKPEQDTDSKNNGEAEIKEPELSADQAASTDATEQKPKKKSFKFSRNTKGSRSETGGKMFTYRSQILPDTIYMRSYPRGNRHMPKAQYEQSWDRMVYVTAARGDLNGLRALINTGRTPDLRDPMGQTPLIVAVRYNKINSARFLLARRADPNAMDNAGNTPLHYAISNNNFPMVEALMTMGAKPDLADSRGMTAGMIAQQSGNPIIIAALGQ
jgi:hypothetical protein